ncbi:MAG: type III secretion system export apparatus subunit SctU [Myxococcaceae bacterium]
MGDESGEKTEEASQKKVDDSRKQGQVWQSKDLTGVMVFLVGLAALKVSWPFMQSEFAKLFTFSFDRLAHSEDLTVATYQLLLMGVIAVVVLTLPVALSGAIVGGLVNFIQIGPLLAVDSLMPKLDKLNPLAGLKNMFTKKQLVEMLKSMLKIFITGYVVYGVVKGAMPMVVATIRAGAPESVDVLGELIFRVAVRVGLLFLLFAIFDVWYQHKTYMKDLMMTKEEVKKEYKESEGDPHNKAKRKELAMELLEGAQMEAVKGADVVVTNPTHVAVALRYDRGRDRAPRVVCKGEGEVAAAIRAVAREGGVAMMRNVPLAHALLRVDLDEEVPQELFDAVAEVLNFIWALERA